MALISIRAYARMRRVDDKTVRKAIAAGKIPLVDGKIDPELADASWTRNRDGGQHSKLAEAALPAPPRLPSAPPELPASPVGIPAAAGMASVSAGLLEDLRPEPEFKLAPLTAARIRNTDVATELKEIARRQLEGTLLEIEEVERTWGELLQTVKDRLRLIPDDLAPSLVACTDEAECRSILMREILTALGSISRDVAGMAAA